MLCVISIDIYLIIYIFNNSSDLSGSDGVDSRWGRTGWECLLPRLGVQLESRIQVLLRVIMTQCCYFEQSENLLGCRRRDNNKNTLIFVLGWISTTLLSAVY